MGGALLPSAAIGMVGMMLFPLPAPVLDMLLVVNLSFSVLLLLSILSIAEPERFTSLPTVLLLSTLFRLSLNISTTRLLLGEGTAPQVVRAFGEFVVGGNLVVGVVVFAMLTLVQFMVVAKGAERVAEVAARFTLDAMPGKQMAIDADIRSGLLSVAEAKGRRVELQRESHLYGALDGAMKFVKGDAIAGIVITLVNISAGLLIGVQQRGLELGVALREYTLLTVGDGLLAQLPALLVAVSAGIAVTRVGGHSEEGIGGELVAQLCREPRALLISGAALLLIGCFPGVPMFPFWCAAAGMFCQCVRVRAAGLRRCSEGEAGMGQAGFCPQVFGGLLISASAALLARLRQEAAFPKVHSELKRRMFERWGLLLPETGFETDARLDGQQLRISIRGVELGQTQSVTEGESVTPRLARHIEDTIAEHRSWLVDDTHVRLLLELYQSSHDDLINAVVPKLLPVTGLTRLLRSLIDEGLSVRPFGCILQAIAEHSVEGRMSHSGRASGDGDGAAAPVLLEAVRTALARTISSTVSEDGRTVQVHLLDSEAQGRLLDAYAQGVADDATLLSSEYYERWVAAVRRVLSVSERGVVVLCPAAIRRRVSELVRSPLARAERDRVFVVAPEELMPDLILQSIGTI